MIILKMKRKTWQIIRLSTKTAKTKYNNQGSSDLINQYFLKKLVSVLSDNSWIKNNSFWLYFFLIKLFIKLYFPEVKILLNPCTQQNFLVLMVIYCSRIVQNILFFLYNTEYLFFFKLYITVKNGKKPPYWPSC